MNFSSIVALVHYNGDIITDELMSSVFVSEVNKYFEVNNYMSFVCSQTNNSQFIHCFLMENHTRLIYVFIQFLVCLFFSVSVYFCFELS